MKWIKRFFLFILALIAIILTVGVFAPKKFHIERSIEVSLPKDSVYQYLKYLKNQDQFHQQTSSLSFIDAQLKKQE